MNELESRLSRMALPAFLLLLLLAPALAACTAPPVAPPPPTQSVEELANALAAVWATQTAQAATAVAGTPGATSEAAPTPTAAMPTETVTPSATGAVAGSAAPTPASAATLTFRPTSTPRAAAGRAPVCEIAAAAELEGGWDWQTLGCPVSDSQTVWAAWEPFQGGYMFWRDDEDSIYALFTEPETGGRQGPALTGGDAWRWDGSNPEGRGLTPPAGSYEPVRGFGRVWSDFLGGPAGQLGWATAIERGFCATLQVFESGVVFRSDNTVRACKDGLLNMATEPSFAPVFVSIHDDSWWQGH